MKKSSSRVLNSTIRHYSISGVLVLMAIGVSGCSTPSASSKVYTYDQAQSEQTARNGTVTNVRSVVIQQDRTSGAGMVAGGALGGVAGSAVGNKAEETVGKSDGLEITVRLDNGQTRVIAQEADELITVGQRVQVISGSGVTRVTPLSRAR